MADNKEIMRRYFELATRGPIEQLATVVAQGVVGFDGNQVVQGLGSIERHIRDVQSGCTDFRFEIDHIIEEGDWVAACGVTSGKQTGKLFGMPASNREFRVQGMAMFRIANNKIVEVRTGWDTLSFAQQLGGLGATAIDNRI